MLVKHKTVYVATETANCKLSLLKLKSCWFIDSVSDVFVLLSHIAVKPLYRRNALLGRKGFNFMRGVLSSCRRQLLLSKLITAWREIKIPSPVRNKPSLKRIDIAVVTQARSGLSSANATYWLNTMQASKNKAYMVSNSSRELHRWLPNIGERINTPCKLKILKKWPTVSQLNRSSNHSKLMIVDNLFKEVNNWRFAIADCIDLQIQSSIVLACRLWFW